MSTWKINLKDRTATAIKGITFNLTETKPGEYEGVCLNPKDIPPDDLGDGNRAGPRKGLRFFHGQTKNPPKTKN